MREDRPIPAILQRLVESSQKRVERLRAEHSIDSLMQMGSSVERRSFCDALAGTATAIIAEIKMASPSKGVFNASLNPAKQASAYVEGGCAAISVVTEPEYFHGDIAWITSIRDSVPVPVLRKDFIIDPIQVAETLASGADAILLIARILSHAQLSELTDSAREMGLDILLEAHDEHDVEMIMDLVPELIGVNARDLDNFSIDIERIARLRTMLPDSALLVAESGIESREQIESLANAGYHAFLVGEALLRSDDPVTLLRSLRGVA